MDKKCGPHWLAWILIIIGGLNWGLVGIGYFFNSNWNLVNRLLSSWPVVEAIVYLLVGVATILVLFKRSCKACVVKEEVGH